MTRALPRQLTKKRGRRQTSFCVCEHPSKRAFENHWPTVGNSIRQAQVIGLSASGGQHIPPSYSLPLSGSLAIHLRSELLNNRVQQEWFLHAIEMGQGSASRQELSHSYCPVGLHMRRVNVSTNQVGQPGLLGSWTGEIRQQLWLEFWCRNITWKNNVK